MMKTIHIDRYRNNANIVNRDHLHLSLDHEKSLDDPATEPEDSIEEPYADLQVGYVTPKMRGLRGLQAMFNDPVKVSFKKRRSIIKAE
jgi:hypothetical protein